MGIRVQFFVLCVVVLHWKVTGDVNDGQTSNSVFVAVISLENAIVSWDTKIFSDYASVTIEYAEVTKVVSSTVAIYKDVKDGGANITGLQKFVMYQVVLTFTDVSDGELKVLPIYFETAKDLRKYGNVAKFKKHTQSSGTHTEYAITDGDYITENLVTATGPRSWAKIYLQHVATIFAVKVFGTVYSAEVIVKHESPITCLDGFDISSSFYVKCNAPCQGNEVEVASLDSNKEMKLTEVEVEGYFEFTNIAKGKNVSFSSRFADQYFNQASVVDGSFLNVYLSVHCFSTVLELNPWFGIDLGGPSLVFEVVIGNIEDQYSHRLRNLKVTVEIGGRSEICGENVDDLTDVQIVSFLCPTLLRGQFVYLEANNDPAEYLQICEFQVMGYNARTYDVLAMMTPTQKWSPSQRDFSQSSAHITEGLADHDVVSVLATENSYTEFRTGLKLKESSTVTWYDMETADETTLESMFDGNGVTVKNIPKITSSCPAENIALTKQTSVSELLGGEKELITDGLFDATVKVTLVGNVGRWIQIDLTVSYIVSKVITYTSNSMVSYMAGFVIKTSMTSSNDPHKICNTYSDLTNNKVKLEFVCALFTIGRYVRVDKSGSYKLSMTEVEIFGFQAINIALGKSYDVSHFSSGSGKLTDGDLHFYIILEREMIQWFQVDLLRLYPIIQVVSHAFPGTPERMSNFNIISSDTSSMSEPVLCGEYLLNTNAEMSIAITCQTVEYKRFVRFQRYESSGYVTLTELEVYTFTIMNLALNAPYTVSSHYNGNAKLTDGLNSGYHNTDPMDSNPWIKIDLGSPCIVLMAVISTKYAVNRMRGFQIQVSNDGNMNVYSVCGDYASLINTATSIEISCAVFSYGRYVRYHQIYIEGMATVGELEVYGVLESWKLSKNLETYFSSGRSTTDLFDGSSGGCITNAGNEDPWMMIDLLNIYVVSQIKVHNENCCSGPLHPFRVDVVPFQSSRRLCGIAVMTQAPVTTVKCIEMVGSKYVNISLLDAVNLYICEVEIYYLPAMETHLGDKPQLQSAFQPLVFDSLHFYNVGVGFHQPPYIGSINGLDMTIEMNAYFLGVRKPDFLFNEQEFLCVFENSNSDEQCGYGVSWFCRAKDFQLGKELCPLNEKNIPCFTVECPGFSAPENVTAVDKNSSCITFAWNGIPQTAFLSNMTNVTEYLIVISDVETGGNVNITVDGNQQTYQACNFTPNTKYSVRIVGAVGEVLGNISDIIFERTENEYIPPPVLRVLIVTSSSIFLNWSDSITDTFNLLVWTENTTTLLQNHTIIGNYSFNVTDLQPNTMYALKISGKHQINGYGPYSNFTFQETSFGSYSTYPMNLTGHYINSTALNVSWGNFTGLQSGAESYYSLYVENTDTTVFQEISMTDHIFVNLTVFTTYRIKVAVCYGMVCGPYSPAINVTTDEIDSGCGAICLRWTNPESMNYERISSNTVLCVYKGYVPPDGTRRKRSLTGDIDYSVNVTFYNTTSVDMTSYLAGNSIYNISVSANSKYPGVFSEPIHVQTDEGVPAVSALNVRCEPLNDRSIVLYWDKSTPVLEQGVIVKYKVYYKKTFEVNAISENAAQFERKKQLLFLTHSTDYSIWLSAFTSKGEGRHTQPVQCTTTESIPSAPPTDLLSSSYLSHDGCLLSWKHIPNDEWNGVPQGYVISYTKLSTGERILFFKASVSIGYVESYLLEGLDTYSTYKVKVAGYTSFGRGRWSLSSICMTCRVSQPLLTLEFSSLPPYVVHTENGGAAGILPKLVSQSILTCSLTCSSFVSVIALDYRNISFVSLNQTNVTKVSLPMIDPKQFSLEFKFVPVYTTPGFVLMEAPEDAGSLKAGVEDILISNILSVIPFCGLYMVVNLLFGIMFWYLEPTEIQRSGPCFSLQGIFEGFYLALITSTTVGYGDKIPLTFRGRLYFVVWTLLGLVLTGMVVGELSSALTSTQIASMQEFVPKDKVIAMYDTVEYEYAKKYFKEKFEEEKKFFTYKDVLSQLHDGLYKYALVDQTATTLLKNYVEEHSIQVSRVIKKPSVLGLLLFGQLQLLENCVTDYVNGHQSILSESLEAVLKEIESKEIREDKEQHNHLTEEDPPLISWEAPLYQSTMLGLFIVIVLLYCIGVIYDRCRVYKKQRMVYSTLELSINRYETLLSDFTVIRTMIDELICTLQVTTNFALYRHGEELLRLRLKISKLYGVNFKHVRFSDLGVSFDEIVELKRTQKTLPREPFLSVLYRRIGRFKMHVERIYYRLT